ncbi:substrate-binding periplasmic protein [Oceanospirillum sediminis]|uniref:Transporter substrate-binding domain-containing protein n=1 Tax=Oceanospirillum sediminis TaxID=2760088 RepID=A0A839IXI7_9GAMM|nr:transporter substrate-binding domain-containing protein [Oceanospirillum sediminis]
MSIRVFVSVMVLIFSSAANSSERQLLLSTGEWPPFISSGMVNSGYVSDIIRQALQSQGYAVVFHFLPWKRAMKSADMLQVDGSFAWYKNAERSQKFHYSAPVLSTSDVFFHRKDFDFEWSTIADLKGLTAVGSFGYQYADEFNKAAETGLFRLIRAKSDAVAMKMVQAGRADIFPINIQAGFALLRHVMTPAEASTMTYHGKTLSAPISSHLIISKDHPDGEQIIADFNRGLKELINNGRYQKMEEDSQKGLYE